jgi:hypothetical protein
MQTSNSTESECDSYLSKVIKLITKRNRHNGKSGGGETILVDGPV